MADPHGLDREGRRAPPDAVGASASSHRPAPDAAESACAPSPDQSEPGNEARCGLRSKGTDARSGQGEARRGFYSEPATASLKPENGQAHAYTLSPHPTASGFPAACLSRGRRQQTREPSSSTRRRIIQPTGKAACGLQ